MKSSKKIISPAFRKTRLKKFSKHWLEAVKLSDLSVLADSSSNEDNGGSPSGGGEILYQIPSYAYYGTWGAGGYVSPWTTSNIYTNPPVFNYSESFICLIVGGHFGIVSIEQIAGEGWRTIAALDGQVLVNNSYGYYGGNQTYMEIDVDAAGDWSFWGDFGCVGANHGSISPYAGGTAQFGCSAGDNDYLMYNAFSNCAASSWNGWQPANFSGLNVLSGPQYQAVNATEDSVLFEDNPPY
jgi:hypothetical protein